MNNKLNALQHYRTRVNIPLHDVAHLLSQDVSNLSKMEQGVRDANLHTIMLYHILFKAPLLELFAEQYDELRVLWKRRSRTLVEKLHANQPPKSESRIEYIHNFVKTLDTESYEG